MQGPLRDEKSGSVARGRAHGACRGPDPGRRAAVAPATIMWGGGLFSHRYIGCSR